MDVECEVDLALNIQAIDVYSVAGLLILQGHLVLLQDDSVEKPLLPEDKFADSCACGDHQLGYSKNHD